MKIIREEFRLLGNNLINRNESVLGVQIGISSGCAVYYNGEIMTREREMQKRSKGFMESAVCRKCYLPRKTDENEVIDINGNKMVIKNYINRKQNVGE